jgi:putative FmdB family regulatory protein
MPSYDFNCKKCDLTFEVQHSMTEKPTVTCPRCKSKHTAKVFPVVNMVTMSSHHVDMGRAVDQVKRNIDMKEELRRDLGIEKIHPLSRSTMKDVYQDAMAQKSYIKESMAQQAEERQKETKAKQKEWTIKALQRTPARAAARTDQKSKEASQKRAIRL